MPHSDRPRSLRVDREFSSRVKRPGRCIHHAPSSNAEVENGLELHSGLPPVIACVCHEVTFTLALLASLLLIYFTHSQYIYFTHPQYIYLTHPQVHLFHTPTSTFISHTPTSTFISHTHKYIYFTHPQVYLFHTPTIHLFHTPTSTFISQIHS